MAKYAFVAAYAEQTLTVIDVTNPANPTYVASVATDKIGKLAYSKGIFHAISYTADSLSCISSIPVVLGHISGPGLPNFLDGAWEIAVRGNYCYISVQYDDGLTIIDISNPNNPIYAGGIYGAGPPNYLNTARGIDMLDDTHCCLSVWNNTDKSFSIIDVSNPASPVIVGQTRHTDFVSIAMKISGSRAYLTNNGAGLIIVDVSDITNPTLISLTNLFTGGNRIDVVGDYAYVTDWSDNALYIVDISNPLLPFVAGSISGPGHPNYLDLAWGIYVKSNIAYVTAYNDNSLVLINVSDPTNPTLLGEIHGAANSLSGAEDVWVPLEDPTVVSNPATVKAISATLNGGLTDDGGEACDCGFEWGENEGELVHTTPTESKVTGELFSHGLTGLTPGKKYYFRAKATNSF